MNPMTRTRYKIRRLDLVITLTHSAMAVQIQDLARLKGSETNKIIGIGLIVGLSGTGDGGKFLPAMRPLAAVVQQLIDPNVVASELANAKNVALVALTATLPSSGVREGDHVDVHVSAIGPAQEFGWRTTVYDSHDRPATRITGFRLRRRTGLHEDIELATVGSYAAAPN